MAVQFRRGHVGPCPLPTRGDSYGATAIGKIHDEIDCSCGRTWQIQEYCLYCDKVKIQHTRHSVRQYWEVVDDRVKTTWLTTLGIAFWVVMTIAVLLILAVTGNI